MMPAAMSQAWIPLSQKAVETAGSHIGQVKRRSADAAHARHLQHDVALLLEEYRMVPAAQMRNAGGEHAVGKLARVRQREAAGRS